MLMMRYTAGPWGRYEGYQPDRKGCEGDVGGVGWFDPRKGKVEEELDIFSSSSFKRCRLVPPLQLSTGVGWCPIRMMSGS